MSNPTIPLHEYNTIQLQLWKYFVVNALSQVPNKEHDHRHAYLLEDLTSFWKRSGIIDGILLTVPTRLVKDEEAFKQYTFYLDVYNTHAYINRDTVVFLKKLCPTVLLGLKVGFGTLPTNLSVDTAFKYLLEMAVEATVDTEVASLQYSSNTNGLTVFFQQVQHL